MKVVMVTSSFPRHPADAAGVFLVPLVRMLMGAGVKVQVVAPHDDGCAPLPGLEVVRVGGARQGRGALFYGDGALAAAEKLGRRAWPLAGAAVLQMARAVLDARADVALCHWLAPSGLAGVVAHALGGPRVVTMVHGSDVRRLRVPGLGALVASGSSRVVAPSASLAREAQLALGRSVEVVPLPVGLEAGPSRFQWHDVGVLGRLLPQKGVDTLLRAAAAAGQTVLVGGAGPERARLEALARTLQARVTFAGPVAPDARASFLGSIRVLAVPSLLPEGLPAVMTEAAACGVPCVGSHVAGVAEFLPASALAAPGDVPAWAALLRTTTEPGWMQMGTRWARWMALGHAPETLLPRWLDVLSAAPPL